MEYLNWYYLIYYIAIAFALLLGIGSLFGGGADSDHDVDADADADGDADDGNIDDHVDHDTVEHDHSFGKGALAFLGIGRIPLMMVLAIFTMSFGITGLCMNVILKGMPTATMSWISLAVASGVSLIGTGRVANILHRVMPRNETAIITKRDLVGRTGKLILPAGNTQTGFARIVDANGDLHEIACRSYEGELPTGVEILLVDYDEGTSVYQIEPLEPYQQ